MGANGNGQPVAPVAAIQIMLLPGGEVQAQLQASVPHNEFLVNGMCETGKLLIIGLLRQQAKDAKKVTGDIPPELSSRNLRG